SDGKVIGMLYVGRKEISVTSLIDSIKKIKIASTGYVFVLNSKGEYIISKDGKRDGENIWESVDANGNKFIQEFIKKAKEQNEGESITYFYPWKNLDDSGIKNKVAVITYFKDWDWVIGASCTVEEMYQPLVNLKNMLIIKIILYTVIFFLIGYVFIKGVIKKLKLFSDIFCKGASGELNIEYPLKNVNCSEIRGCGQNACPDYGKDGVSCWFDVGSYAPSFGKEVHCPRVKKGLIKSCLECNVYQEVCSDEINTMAAWFNKFIRIIGSLVKEVKNSANSVSGASVKLGDMVNKIASGSEETAASVEETASTINQFAATTNHIVDNVNNQTAAVIQTTSSAKRLSSDIDEVNKSLMEVKSSVNQTTAAIEEMIQNIKQITENMNIVDQKSKESGIAAVKGKDSVDKANAGIERVKNSMITLVNVIDGLGKSAENIGSILEVIDDISEQTNLLALNAAIEAARAGEHGKGFAVVADEVRKLAERSSKSTKEIADIIKTIQTETQTAIESTKEGAKNAEEGVNLSRQVSESLNDISAKINEMSSLIKHVANSMNEQNLASEQIVKQMENVNNITESASRSSAGQAKSTSEIVNAMNDVQKISEQIKIAMNEQANGSVQINTAVQQISDTSQENANYASEVSEEAENLNNISNNLKSKINVFKI
ncbi:Cache 3/Cache 2 fusion domain-containing protein, partial [Candidatus Dependentiae bacterium]|nr:Cache 3/Cache 2 fusion domain-containing protein [Candidatus Dependentiae bacterium]